MLKEYLALPLLPVKISLDMRFPKDYQNIADIIKLNTEKILFIPKIVHNFPKYCIFIENYSFIHPLPGIYS